jgi:hypothetical protein
MDSTGVGTPFLLAGILVMLALPLTAGLRRARAARA